MLSTRKAADPLAAAGGTDPIQVAFLICPKRLLSAWNLKYILAC
jgi:hypothetical protein